MEQELNILERIGKGKNIYLLSKYEERVVSITRNGSEVVVKAKAAGGEDYVIDYGCELAHEARMVGTEITAKGYKNY